MPDEVDEVQEKTHTLDPIWFTEFLAASTRREYLTDEPVFSQGDPAQVVFYILSGKVRLTVRSADGEQAVISVLSKGSFLGESCLAGRTDRETTASALLHSTIVCIEKQAMTDLLRRDPEFAELFLAYTLSCSIRLEADLIDQFFNSSHKRLARTQMMKGKFIGEWKPIPVSANISPESFAEIIGTTDSNVSFLLEGFRELGFIDSRGAGMRVHSSLMSIVSQDNGVC